MELEGSSSLSDFFDHPILNSSYFQDRRVVVVGIIGKETAEHSKTECINAMLQRSAFVENVELPNSSALIDVYFAADIFTVFLCLRGYGDVNKLYAAFHAKDSKQGFFDVLSHMEEDYIKKFVFLLMTCHILLFVEPCCRFDLSISRTLKRANELRLSCLREVCDELSKLPKFSQHWAEEGRIARPRLLLALYRHPLKADIGSLKKKDLISKLEQSIENQAFNILKANKVIGNPKKRNNAVSIRSEGFPFVHIFSSNEALRDRIRDLIITIMDDNDEAENKDYADKDRNRFARFLEENIDEVRNDKERNTFYELPRMKRFLLGCKTLSKLLFQGDIIDQEKMDETLNIELMFSRSMGDSYLTQAKATYLSTEPREEKGKRIVYTQKQHEFKLLRAMERLESLYHGSELEKAKNELRLQCEEVWEGKKACEAISLTGNLCILSSHFSPMDLKVPAAKRTVHSSSARFLSTCNCGRSQSIRKDPFNLKEANCSFFMQPTFSCCRNLESYEFVIFDKSGSSSNAPSRPAQQMSQDQDSAFPPLKGHSDTKMATENLSQEGSGDQIEILLDRDNRYLLQESQDASELPHEGSLLLSGDDGNSVASAGSEEHNSDDEGRNQKVEEEPSTTEPDFGKAHMDEYASSGEENESLPGEVGTSYLDDDEVQLREAEGSLDERTRTLAVEYEEELSRLRETFRGQFLEWVPNSDSPAVLPLFPSWSLVCLGSSSIYSHKFGLRDAPNFKNGTQFLLPLDCYLNVDVDSWEADMKEIMSESISYRSRRHLRGSSGREKVKLFVGFEYECPRGHRFMIRDPQTPVLGPISSKDSGSALLRSELPLWMPCTCRRAPKVSAQLMRLHVVTPKAPVTVTVDPRVQPSMRDTVFYTGEEPIHLEWARYYVLRFPYIYAGQQGPIYMPDKPLFMGKLLPNCINVEYNPLH